MGSASITIKVDGKWSGGSAISAAQASLKGLAATATASADGVSRYFDRQQKNAERLSRLAASTVKSTTSDLATLGNSLVQTGGRIYDVGKGLEEVGDTLTRSVTVPLVAIGGYAAQAAVSYDTALANVRKTTDLTEQELEQLGEAAVELSTKQPVTAEAILNVEALGAQLGVAEDKLQSFAQVVTGLDIATNMDAETAGTEMARFANIVGMAQEDFERYGSTIVAIGNNMATTESEVSNMAQRFASAGVQAGLSEAQILGMSGAMSSLGLRAEMGGSSLSQVFAGISQSVALGSEDLAKYAAAAGMSAEQFASAWREDAAGAFVSLLQGIHDATEAGKDMNVILSDLDITQIRQSDTMRRLAGSVDVVRDAVSLATGAWEENVALQNEVDSRNESMASRLQVLKNNVDALAIEVGVPLVNALIDALGAAQPLFDAVAEGAEWFSDADEDTQRFVLGIAGIATAAGPAISVLGKLTQGLGGAVTSFGHFIQDVSVFGDAMNTVDGSLVRVYASSDTLATKMGLARNAVVQAAGGADVFVDAWERNYSAQKRVTAITEQLTGLQRQQATATGKSAESIAKKIASLDSERVAAQATLDSTTDLINGWKQQAGVAKDATTATNKGTSALSSLGNGAKLAGGSLLSAVGTFAKFAAGAVALTAVTSVIGLVVGALADMAAEAEEARQHQILLEDATRSVSEIMGEARGAASGMGDAIGGIEPDVDGVLEKMRDLNESVGDTFEEFYVSSSKLDQYVSVIGELANKSGLSASEQWKLEQAVEGYNEVTGEQYSVIDAVNGKIADQDGVIQDNTDQINANAEAWRQRAKAEAMQGLATKYLEAEAEAAYNLQVAQDDLAASKEQLAEKQGRYNAVTARMNEINDVSSQEWRDLRLEQIKLEEEIGGLTETVDEQQGAVNDLSETYDAAAQSARTFSDWAEVQAAGLDAATTEMAQSMATAFNEMGPTVNNALSEMGVNIVDLSVKLAQAGLDTTDLSRITATEFASMVESCGGDTDALIQMIGDASFAFGTKVNEITGHLNSMQGNVAASMESAGIDINEFANAMVNAGYTADDLKNISSEDFAQMLASCGGDIGALITKIGEYNATHLSDKSARVNVDTSDIDLAVTKWNRANFGWKTTGVSVNFSAGSTTVSGHVYGMSRLATGGIIAHADGGIMKHADGFIASRAILLNPNHMVGEAGAEAVVPLTNERYVRPFARAVANEVAEIAYVPRLERGPRQETVNNVTNTYNVTIDGATIRASDRAGELISLLFDEFCLTADMGVR